MTCLRIEADCCTALLLPCTAARPIRFWAPPPLTITLAPAPAHTHARAQVIVGVNKFVAPDAAGSEAPAVRLIDNRAVLAKQVERLQAVKASRWVWLCVLGCVR